MSGERFFAYWRAEPLRAVIEAAGWSVDEIDRNASPRGGHWLSVFAHRA